MPSFHKYYMSIMNQQYERIAAEEKANITTLDYIEKQQTFWWQVSVVVKTPWQYMVPHFTAQTELCLIEPNKTKPFVKIKKNILQLIILYLTDEWMKFGLYC